MRRARTFGHGFWQFVRDADEYAAAHVLAVVRSHYLGVKLQRLEASVSSNTDQKKVDELWETSRAAAAKIIANVDLCGEDGEASQ